jgi:transcriptional antiterminator NusG
MTCAYVPGQALELLSGPWEGFEATFKDVIKAAHDEFAKVRVEMELFGSKREVTVDPDGIRAA